MSQAVPHRGSVATVQILVPDAVSVNVYSPLKFELSPKPPAVVDPTRLMVIKLAVPPGDVSVIVMSPAHEWVSVTLLVTSVSGAVRPATLKLITSGAAGKLSGIGPTPVPGMVDVGPQGVAVGVAVGVFVGVAVGVFVGVAVGVFVGVAVGVFVGVAVGVGVAIPPIGAVEVTQFEELPINAKFERVPLFAEPERSFRVVIPALLPPGVP